MVFLLVIGLLVGALASWTAGDLKSALSFQNSRNAQYALSSTSQVAIQNIRYTPLLGLDGSNQTLNASPPSYCWGPTPGTGDGTVSELTVPVPNNPAGIQVAVWCSTVWNPTSASTRVVTVSACLTSVIPTPSTGSSLTSVQTAAAACAANPGLQTILTFDDYSASNPTPNPGTCLTPPQGTCGAGMTINSSTIGIANPTVTSLSSTLGPATGGSTLTVAGTGFVAGYTTVNFFATSASNNIVLAGTDPTVATGSTTSLSVTIPPTTTVTSFYVIVSTPNGSSAAGSQATYTYQSVLPTVSSITTPSGAASGSAGGGSSLTITGTGFLSIPPANSTTVNFVDTANPAVVLTAPYLTVNSYVDGVQTITATTPVVTTGTTYYVTVTTAPGGTSAESAATEFTFLALYPIAGTITPATGVSGTSVTVTGIGFVSTAGATTVQLVPTSGNGTLTATNVSVSSTGTTLTATIPPNTDGGINTFYVEVTTTWNGTQYASGSSGAPLYTY